MLCFCGRLLLYCCFALYIALFCLHLGWYEKQFWSPVDSAYGGLTDWAELSRQVATFLQKQCNAPKILFKDIMVNNPDKDECGKKSLKRHKTFVETDCKKHYDNLSLTAFCMCKCSYTVKMFDSTKMHKKVWKAVWLSLCQNNIHCTLLQIYSRTFLEFSRALAGFLVRRFEKSLKETQTFKEK